METNPSFREDDQREMEEESNVSVKAAKSKDIRSYLCKYCGISRSKKYLITSHINSHHQMEVEEERDDEASCDEDDGEVSCKHTCNECSAQFKKLAHLKQHMQSHSLERPFVCYVDDCTSSYRRKDHLNRHLLTHKGKLFKCPVEKCKIEFSVHGNVGRHVKKFHSNADSRKDATVDDNSVPSECTSGQKQHVCKEIGCGKAFNYASYLLKHQDSHVKLDSVESFCAEPACMKYFTNEECLRAHIRTCHQHINCEICGSKQLKKNIKRHLRTHDEESTPREVKCEVEGCSLTFSKASNLQKHVKAAHEGNRPYVCGFQGCGMRFAYKHVRDKHEKTGRHLYTCGDFVETDLDITSRPRGGLKRKQVTVEMLVRKRVMSLHSGSE